MFCGLYTIDFLVVEFSMFGGFSKTTAVVWLTGFVLVMTLYASLRFVKPFDLYDVADTWLTLTFVTRFCFLFEVSRLKSVQR